MLHLPHPRAALLTLLVIPLVVAPPPARGATAAPAPPPCGSGGGVASRVLPAADATVAAATVAYLQAQAKSVLGPAQTRALAARCLPGSPLARRQATLARGARVLSRELGHTTTAVSCRVTIGELRVSPASGAATATARVVTLVTWTDARGRSNTEGDGLDHVVTLARNHGRWLVTRDAYSSDLTPRLLEAAGAPAAAVAAAARRLEAHARSLSATAGPATVLGGIPPAGRALAAGVRPGYSAKFTFDRDAAKAYADKYALSYNPTFTSFSSDCADFGSQVMYAGGYPQFGSTYTSGWWYAKNGTSSPNDDSYSHAWIAVTNQQAAWNLRYTDFVSSIGGVGKGDFVYYDWTGDGTWDHVAELVGTNSAGQKVIDAHTTDHYHVFWKLGTSATRYRFARTRATVVV